MIFKRVLLLAVISVLPTAVGDAGEKADALRDSVASFRMEAGTREVVTSRAKKLLSRGLDRLDSAVEIIDAGDPPGVRKAFGPLGAGLRDIQKAAKKEDSEVLAGFASDGAADIWLAANGLFSSGDVSTPPTEEEAKILTRIGRKLKKPFRLVSRGKHAQAIRRLGKAYKLLLRIQPDP